LFWRHPPPFFFPPPPLRPICYDCLSALHVLVSGVFFFFCRVPPFFARASFVLGGEPRAVGAPLCQGPAFQPSSFFFCGPHPPFSFLAKAVIPFGPPPKRSLVLPVAPSPPRRRIRLFELVFPFGPPFFFFCFTPIMRVSPQCSPLIYLAVFFFFCFFHFAPQFSLRPQTVHKFQVFFPSPPPPTDSPLGIPPLNHPSIASSPLVFLKSGPPPVFFPPFSPPVAPCIPFLPFVICVF